jgi:nitrilase
MNSSDDVPHNLDNAARFLKKARDAGALLAVLPENFAMMVRHDLQRLEIAEADDDGPIQSFLAEQAANLEMWIVGGTVPLQVNGEDRPVAACLVYDDRGVRVARYDKIFLFDVSVPDRDEAYQESATTLPGVNPMVIDSPLGRLGLAVCYDIRFPELFRKMLDQDMQCMVLPAAFTAATGMAHWEILLRARAIENLSYVIAAAQTGQHVNGRETWGHSMIIDPWGRILDQLVGEPGVVCADLDLQLEAETRNRFPALDHRGALYRKK